MARARNIKPGFFKNEFLAEMPCEVRLLFIGLWTLADREGRLEDRPKRIKAELFAFDSFDVDSMLNILQRDSFVLRYEVDGVRFVQIENFVKHQDPHYKERASEIPAPDGRDNMIVASGVTRTQRARIYSRDDFTCQSCGSKEHLCIDHILPVSRGGDSSDDNLQTLCMSCNTSKGNKLDGEEKSSRQRRIDVGSNLNQKNRPSPSDSLIPDSLIPDSLNLIPESPIPSVSVAEKKSTELETVSAAVAPATEKQDTKLQADCKTTWSGYSEAYERRYCAKPVRNQKVNSLVKQFVQRLGGEEAPMIAEWFVSHPGGYYVGRMHDFGCLLSDAEKLRTEWATGRVMTQGKARQSDRKGTTGAALAEVLAEMGAQP